nr:MAG TPA: hypothetical protein [Caudoviricetes sp.]
MTGEFTIISPLGTELELFDNKYFTLDDIEGQTENDRRIYYNFTLRHRA